MNADTPRIYRIIVPVSDAQQAVSFYARLLGIEARAVGGGRNYFDCGPVILTILENKKPPASDYIYFSVADLAAVLRTGARVGLSLTGPNSRRGGGRDDPAALGRAFFLCLRPGRQRTLFCGRGNHLHRAVTPPGHSDQ